MEDTNNTDALLLHLTDVLTCDSVAEDFDFPAADSVSDFRHTGLMTRDDGLVVRLPDGSVFHLTVQLVRSGS